VTPILEMGWAPSIGLREGIATTCAWYSMLGRAATPAR